MESNVTRTSSHTHSTVKVPLTAHGVAAQNARNVLSASMAAATTATTTTTTAAAIAPSAAALNRYAYPRENEHKVMHFVRQLSKCNFYFYGINTQTVQQLSQFLKSNLAKVDSFFSSEITHLVVKDDVYERADAQYKENGKVVDDATISNAYARKMHIWSLSKLRKITRYIAQYTYPHTRNGQLLHGDLASQLRNETIYGPVGQQHDIHYFPDHEHYLLIEDLTGHCRPPIVEKYPLRCDNQDVPWPRIWRSNSHRSPFLKPKDTMTRPNTTAAAAAAAAQGTAKLAASRAMSQGVARNHAMASSSLAQKRGSAMASSRKPEPFQSRAVSLKPLRENATTQQSNLPATLPHDVSVQEVSMASGLHPSATTTATLSTPSLATMTGNQSIASNPSGVAMERLNRRVLARLEENGVQYANGRRTTKAVTGMTDKQPVETTNMTTTKQSVTKLRTTLREDAAALNNKQSTMSSMPCRAGYCESCKEKFTNMSNHGKGEKHRRFVMDPLNWKQVDDLLLDINKNTLLVTISEEQDQLDLDSPSQEESEESWYEEEEEEEEDEDDDNDGDEDEETTSAPCSPSTSTNVISSEYDVDITNLPLKESCLVTGLTISRKQAVCVPPDNNEHNSQEASSDIDNSIVATKRQRLDVIDPAVIP
ncbi:hypothetical protein BDF22DRAFT_743688 [Syncephalis plumigaleata]|nr:hypothetical protein BDF22DRAFT_743688 [Syncephalis plumigaleata]